MQQMKVKFRQNTPSGCGSYSIANLFCDADMLEGISTGNDEGIAQLNLKLIRFEPEYYIEVLILYMHDNRVGLESMPLFSIDLAIHGSLQSIVCRPLLFTIKRANDRLHMILVVHDFLTNKFHVVDSLCEFINEMDIPDFFSKYYVVAVSHFCAYENEQPNTLLVNKEILDHIFA